MSDGSKEESSEEGGGKSLSCAAKITLELGSIIARINCARFTVTRGWLRAGACAVTAEANTKRAADAAGSLGVLTRPTLSPAERGVYFVQRFASPPFSGGFSRYAVWQCEQATPSFSSASRI